MYVPTLDRELTYIKGVGPNRSELLRDELGIRTIRDLLLDFPMRYEDRTHFVNVRDIGSNGDVVQLRGIITSMSLIGSGRKKRLVGHFQDETGSLDLETVYTNTPFKLHNIIGERDIPRANKE